MPTRAFGTLLLPSTTAPHPPPAYAPLHPHWLSSEDTLLLSALHGRPSVHRARVLEMPSSPYHPLWLPDPPGHRHPPDLSCLMRPLLALGSTGRKSLNQVISGSGLPLAAHSIVAVRVRSTTFSWGPMSMLGKPGGSWSSEGRDRKSRAKAQLSHGHPSRVGLGDQLPWTGATSPHFPSGTEGCGCSPRRGHCVEGKWPQSQFPNVGYVPGSVQVPSCARLREGAYVRAVS